jgi:enhancing lycopene biosynthesis protein 2
MVAVFLSGAGILDGHELHDFLYVLGMQEVGDFEIFVLRNQSHVIPPVAICGCRTGKHPK